MEKNINNDVQPDVCAIVTTFKPDADFPERVLRIKSQVQCVIIVDDGASIANKEQLTKWFGRMHPDIMLLHHSTNRGVAAALNTGMERVASMGFTFALLLDDDSIILPEMVKNLLAAFNHDKHQMPAIIGSKYICAGEDLINRDSEQLKELPAIITAGSMVPLKVFQLVGPFREELFIDYIDMEYCLRARLRGVRILQFMKAGMIQPIGQRQKTFYGELRSVHNPLRTYYFFRNSLAVAREYAWRFPGFLIWAGCQQAKALVKILFFMRPKLPYFKAMLHGLANGWSRRYGRISDEIVLE